MEELKIHFIGRGEVRDFEFTQLDRDGNCCLFKVKTPYGISHYEVFKIQKKTIPNSTVTYEAYPTSRRFGLSAWTFRDYDQAINKFNLICARNSISGIIPHRAGESLKNCVADN